ncbi:hypothetical protein J2X02_001702 [Pseudoxanthomonas japonensis]|nr:hypothetical protein [Pseudoxanthomonas japonensis]
MRFSALVAYETKAHIGWTPHGIAGTLGAPENPAEQ